MRSVRHPSFVKRFEKLTPDQQAAARQAFQDWKDDPSRVGWHLLAGMKSPLFAAKIGYGNRAIALVTPDEQGQPFACWLWVGSHEDYNNEMKGLRQRSEKDVVKGLNTHQRQGPNLGQALKLKKSSPVQRVNQPRHSRSPA